jgi:hypothetical protein
MSLSDGVDVIYASNAAATRAAYAATRSIPSWRWITPVPSRRLCQCFPAGQAETLPGFPRRTSSRVSVDLLKSVTPGYRASVLWDPTGHTP